MGLENFGERKQVIPFKNEFAELKKSERRKGARIKDLFQENAKLSLSVASDDLEMTEHQKRYYQAQLGNLKQEIKGVFEELQGIRPADDYYKEIKKEV